MSAEPSEDHIAFVQAVVALAKQHRMNNLTIQFRTSVCGRWKDQDRLYYGMVTGTWSEGRHGDTADISIRFEGTLGVPELKGPTP